MVRLCSRLKIHYAWVILTGCFLLSCSGTTILVNSVGIFIKPVSTAMGFSRASFALFYTFSTLVATVMAPTTGLLLKLVDTAVSDASGDANGDREYHHDSQNDDKNGGVKRQFLCFLLLSDLFFRHFGGLLLIAKLLLAGCAHVIKSSHLSFWS